MSITKIGHPGLEDGLRHSKRNNIYLYQSYKLTDKSYPRRLSFPRRRESSATKCCGAAPHLFQCHRSKEILSLFKAHLALDTCLRRYDRLWLRKFNTASICMFNYRIWYYFLSLSFNSVCVRMRPVRSTSLPPSSFFLEAHLNLYV